VVDRVPGDDLVPDRKAQREPQHDSCLPGSAIALPRELLDEVVAAGDADLSERELGEGRGDEGEHVPFVEQPGRAGEPVLDLHVLKPVVDQRGEPAVRAELDEAGLEQGTFRELPLERELSRGRGRPRALHGTEHAVPVTVAGARFTPALAQPPVADLPEGADRSAGPSHAAPRSCGMKPGFRDGAGR